MVVAACLSGTGAAVAQSAYPVRPVRVITPAGPGSGNDLIARATAEELGRRLGRQLIVDNRGGGGMVIGGELAARAAPDGHTLCNLTSSAYLNPFLQAKMPFDLQKDFVPVALLAAAVQRAVHRARTIAPLAFSVAHLAWVALVVAFIPLVLVTATLLIGIFAMPAMVAHVADTSYPGLARLRGGTFAEIGAGQEVEYLRANAGAAGLTLTGNELSNRLYGGAGNDSLNGGDGNDAEGESGAGGDADPRNDLGRLTSRLTGQHAGAER